MRYFILFIFLVGCASQKTETKPESSPVPPPQQPMSLKDLSSQPMQSGPEEMIKWFERCAAECKGHDQKISESFAQGYKILFKISSDQPVYEKLTKAQKKEAEQGKDFVRQAFISVLETQNDADMIMTAWGTLADPESDYKLADKKLKPLTQKTIARLKSSEMTKELAMGLESQYKVRFKVK